MTETNHDERRRLPRAALPATVDLEFPSVTSFADQYVANVSAGGMFIACGEQFPVGTPVEFRLHLSDGYDLIRGRGRVVWVRGERGDAGEPPGMAVQFLELEPRSRELIGRMVEQHLREGGSPFRIDRERAREELSVRVPDGDPFPVGDSPTEPGGTAGADVFAPPVIGPFDDEEPPAAGGGLFDVEPVDHGARSGGSPWRTAAVAVAAAVVLGLAAWWFTGSSPVRGEEDVAQHASPVEVPGPAGEDSGPLGADLGSGVASPATEVVVVAEDTPAGGAEQPGEVGSAGIPVGPGEEPGPAEGEAPAGDAPRVAEPVPVAPATRVERIVLGRGHGGSVVSIGLDGSLTGERIRHFPMDAPPRYGVQLRGIRSPYRGEVVGAGTPEVERVRVGFHGEVTPPELHVVLDLAAAGAVEVVPKGGLVEIRVAGSGGG